MAKKAGMARVAGRGGDGPVDAAKLQELVDAVSDINRDSGKFWALRLNAEATRFQKWPGQSPDGKQRAEYIGSAPFPFDGASDQRVYWADTLSCERVRLFIVAAWRAVLTCLPLGKGRSDDAWRGTQVLKWFVQDMGRRWWQELTRAANYAVADSPAVAVVKVWFERCRELETRRLTAAELAELYVRLATEQAGGEADTEAVQAAALEFEAALSAAGAGAERGGRIGDASLPDAQEPDTALQDLILAYFDVTPARARKAAKQIAREGAAEFPVPGEWRDALKVKALRYGDDFYMPDNATDWDDLPYWFEKEWVSEAALRERAAREEWSAAWVEEVLKHEQEAAFDEYEVQGLHVIKSSCDLHKGQYQIVTAHYRALNDDGVPGRYECVFHAGVTELTAFGRRLEEQSASVFFSGEIIDGWLLNSRGIAEKTGPAAGVVKGMQDDMCDGARIMLLPPLTGDGYGTGKDESPSIEPLGYIPLKRGGKLSFLGGMQYPAHALEVLKGMRRDRDEHFARPGENVPQQISDTAAEYEVLGWLWFVQEIYRAGMGLIARHVSDSTLTQITDRGGRPVAPEGRGMLADRWRVQVVFDTSTLDEKRTIEKFTALTQLKQSDTENVLYMTPMIKAGTRALFPHHADEALQLGNEGQEAEWRQERDNYLSLRAGVTPRMVDDGTWNYELRLQFYTDMLAQNPAALDDLSEDKRGLLENWLKFLQQQATQYGVNREIGRTGVKEEEK